jgi:hypothetical protein
MTIGDSMRLSGRVAIVTGAASGGKALSLAKECCAIKLDLLTNATVVDDVIGFVIGNRESATKQNFIE